MHEVEVTESCHITASHEQRHFKDAVLDWLGERANVAQFVSFGPDLSQRYSRVQGFAANHIFQTLEDAISSLLRASVDASVNVRSYTPENPKSREFVYGVQDVERAASEVRRLSQAGLYTIINETVNIDDGGVSGVVLGNVIEFAPGDTPRCVEKPGTASLPREIGLRLLEKVYQVKPSLDYQAGTRVEFSIHPIRRGYNYEHTIIWEMEEVAAPDLRADLQWPNIFSRFIGDKAFGLLVADALGVSVPLTTVLSRVVAPFTFGKSTGSGEFWIRTCPVEQDPGHYTTQRGWLDPYKLMMNEDPEGNRIASILSQEGVSASFSGSLVTDNDGGLIIEGVSGFGDKFMVGQTGQEDLPDNVRATVVQLFNSLSKQLGPVRMEWVYDSREAWVVQLHRGATLTSGNTIYPGDPNHYRTFKVDKGIDALRTLISEVRGTEDGIVLLGNVGVTSHFGDLLRRARIPSRIKRMQDN